jgi:hypothetical protein
VITYPEKIHSATIVELMKHNVIDRQITVYRAKKIEPYFDERKGEPEAPGVGLPCWYVRGEVKWVSDV